MNFLPIRHQKGQKTGFAAGLTSVTDPSPTAEPRKTQAN
jgi:hypothetical protein